MNSISLEQATKVALYVSFFLNPPKSAAHVYGIVCEKLYMAGSFPMAGSCSPEENMLVHI
jgi:hypothetical protein